MADFLHPASPDELTVAFICTGNRARSALAESLYNARARGLPTSAASYGTADVGPAPALPQAIAAGMRVGVDLSEHRARALSGVRLSGVDLVLGFEVEHLATAVTDGAASPEKSFLFMELVGLLTADEGENDDAVARARRRIASADARRVRSRPDLRAVIADPISDPDRLMERTANLIDGLVGDLVASLFAGAGNEQTGERAAY